MKPELHCNDFRFFQGSSPVLDVQVRAHRDVLANGLVGKRLDDLECTSHAETRVDIGGAASDVATIKMHFAAIGREEPRHQREQSGFAGAVGANQRAQAALGYFHTHVLYCL